MNDECMNMNELSKLKLKLVMCDVLTGKYNRKIFKQKIGLISANFQRPAVETNVSLVQSIKGQ